jgi:hypothetical protein
MAIAIDACAAQHQGDRKEQQDRVAILPHARARVWRWPSLPMAWVAHRRSAGGRAVVHTAKTNLDQFLGADESPQQMLRNSMRRRTR